MEYTYMSFRVPAEGRGEKSASLQKPSKTEMRSFLYVTDSGTFDFYLEPLIISLR